MLCKREVWDFHTHTHISVVLDHVIYETGHVTNQAPPTNLSEVSEPLCLLGDAAGQEDVCLWLFIVFLQHDLDGSVAELRVVTVLVGGHAAVTEREDLGEEGRRERERRERERRERERREEGGGREKGEREKGGRREEGERKENEDMSNFSVNRLMLRIFIMSHLFLGIFA